MINEKFNEQNYAMIIKLIDINPYFKTAIDCLYHCSICNLQDDPNMYEEYRPIIFPNIIITDNPYPNIECKTSSVFKKQNRIEISYGVLFVLGALGKFGDTLDKIYRGIAEEISLESLYQINIDDLKSCIEDILRYLSKVKELDKGEIPYLPEMTLSKDLLFYSIKFLVGHELSHYLDYYYVHDVRVERQLSAFRECNELLKSFKTTAFEKNAAQFYIKLFNSIAIAGVPEMRMLQLWSEEVLADLEGYQYLCPKAPVGYHGFRKLLGIGIAFIMTKIIEYFQFLTNNSSNISIEISWREAFLQYNIYRKFGDYYDCFMSCLEKEFGGWLCLMVLYARSISELNTEWGNKDKSTTKNIGESNDSL